MGDTLHYLSAVEALEKFRNRELSPVELLQATIEQSELWEPHINAFSHTFFEQAMEEARASEARYVRGEPMGVLDGLLKE